MPAIRSASPTGFGRDASPTVFLDPWCTSSSAASPTSDRSSPPPSPAPKKPRTRRHPPGHIPRPRNAFIFFRSDFYNTMKCVQHSEKLHQQNVSIEVGKAWRALSEAEQAPYYALQEQEKAAHKRKYPNYTCKARPSTVARKQRKPVSSYGKEVAEPAQPSHLSQSEPSPKVPTMLTSSPHLSLSSPTPTSCFASDFLNTLLAPWDNCSTSPISINEQEAGLFLLADSPHYSHAAVNYDNNNNTFSLLSPLPLDYGSLNSAFDLDAPLPPSFTNVTSFTPAHPFDSMGPFFPTWDSPASTSAAAAASIAPPPYGMAATAPSAAPCLDSNWLSLDWDSYVVNNNNNNNIHPSEFQQTSTALPCLSL